MSVHKRLPIPYRTDPYRSERGPPKIEPTHHPAAVIRDCGLLYLIIKI